MSKHRHEDDRAGARTSPEPPGRWGHTVRIRYHLDGGPTYRPYASCGCGWEGGLRSTPLEAEMDGRWHGVETSQVVQGAAKPF